MGDNDQATSNFRLISLTGGPQCTTWSHKFRKSCPLIKTRRTALCTFASCTPSFF